MVSRAPSKQPSPAALEYARALIEYADGLRAEPPRAEGVSAAELYLALRALGRDPVEVARKARERWERQRAERQAAGAPAATAPSGAASPSGGGLKPRQQLGKN